MTRGRHTAFVLGLTLLLPGRGAYGQTPPAAPDPGPSPIGEWLLNHVSIRQSLKDKNTIHEPASVYLTFPEDGDATKEINGAISVGLTGPDPEFSAGLAVQFNENTALGRRQNALKAGLDLGWLRSVGPVERPKFFSDFAVIAGFKRNGEKHTDGLAADAYWTFSAPRARCRYCPQLDIGGLVNYLPLVGVEYERALRAADPGDEGGVMRTLTQLKVNVFPLRRLAGKRVTLTADLAYRYDVQTDFDGDRSHPYGEFSISYGVDPHNIFLIGVDYVRGENPDEGFEGQRFVRLSVQVQFDRPQKDSIREARAARARRP